MSDSITIKKCECGEEMTRMGTFKTAIEEYWFCPYCCETEPYDSLHRTKIEGD